MLKIVNKKIIVKMMRILKKNACKFLIKIKIIILILRGMFSIYELFWRILYMPFESERLFE